MTKEEKIGVLITVVYILYVCDEFALVDIDFLALRFLHCLSGVITSLIIRVVGWGVYYIFSKRNDLSDTCQTLFLK